MGQVLSGRSVTGEGGAHGIPVLTLNYRPLMDCWGGEATVFGCEITDQPPDSRGHLGKPRGAQTEPKGMMRERDWQGRGGVGGEGGI